MINVNDWDRRRQRYEEYWTRRNSTPILYLTSPSDKIITRDIGKTTDRWNDCAHHCRESRLHFENTYYAADSYPYVLPDLGYDPATAMLGLETQITETSSWAVHQDKDLSEYTDFSFDENNALYRHMLEAIGYFVNDAKNLDYIVGMIPFNTLFDGVSSLIGPDRLCIEMIDNPDEVHRVSRAYFELFKTVYTVFENLTRTYQKGNTNWLGVYSDVPWYYISNDFIVMLSEEFFDEFIMETLLETVKFHPRTLFHLDGENAVRHLDALLKIDGLTGVQVQATPAKHCAEFWVPHLQKIQAAGKTAWIEARKKEDLKGLVKNLEPEGLFIKAWADTKAEALEMEKFVNDYYGAGK